MKDGFLPSVVAIDNERLERSHKEHLDGVEIPLFNNPPSHERPVDKKKPLKGIEQNIHRKIQPKFMGGQIENPYGQYGEQTINKRRIGNVSPWDNLIRILPPPKGVGNFGCDGCH